MNSHSLHDRIEELERENAALRAKVEFFETCPRLMRGRCGERIVSRATGANPTRTNAPYDLTSLSGDRIEVKFSKVIHVGSGTRRWAWNNLLGHGGRKTYDRLILMGESDVSRDYGDASPYVIFDVPFDFAVEQAEIRKTRRYCLTLNTDPRQPRTDVGRRLFGEYRVSVDDLKRRYVI